MREIDRIDRICVLLNRMWHEHPDQRLGQLLANYIFGHHKDIYYQEDDITEELLSMSGIRKVVSRKMQDDIDAEN